MYRGTTPTLYFRINNIEDLNDIEDILITIKGYKLTLEKNINDVDIDFNDNIISLKLTEEETFSFTAPSVKIQLKIKTADENICVSPIYELSVQESLSSKFMNEIEEEQPPVEIQEEE